MNELDIYAMIDQQMKADRQNENWPDHAAGQAGKVMVQSGELMRISMESKYRPENHDDEVFKKQKLDAAVKIIASAMRYIQNL